MDTVQNYKCPDCGDALVFDPKTQNLHCPSCESDFSLETLKELDEAEAETVQQSKYDWEHYEPRKFDSDETSKLADYTCPSCGAEITGDDTLGATICPYCGNSTIIKSAFEGSFAPDYIIPFKIDKKSAEECFEKACSKAPFLPDEWRDKKRIAEMSGVYVPFWMFDCDANASITYSAHRIRMWSDSKYNYTKTDHFRLYRKGKISFCNLPVDGSAKTADEYTEALEPFDTTDAVNFSTAFLSGFLADKYDVSADESKKRANQRIKTTTEERFARTTGGYEAVIPTSSGISFSDGKVRYSLLPVWMLNIKYMDKIYKYAINGQTGKTVGEFPICLKKRNLYFAKVFGICFAIMAALSAIYYLA